MSLASKVKSLASKTQVLENYPVLGSRTALYFELLKFCRSPKKFFEDPCFLENAWKFFWRPFFVEHLRLCPWPRAFLSLASRRSVLGRAVPGLGFFCALGLEPCVLDFTSDQSAACYTAGNDITKYIFTKFAVSANNFELQIIANIKKQDPN